MENWPPSDVSKSVIEGQKRIFNGRTSLYISLILFGLSFASAKEFIPIEVLLFIGFMYLFSVLYEIGEAIYGQLYFTRMELAYARASVHQLAADIGDLQYQVKRAYDPPPDEDMLTKLLSPREGD